MKPVVLVLVLASAFSVPVEQSPQAVMNRAVAAFEKGRFVEAATAFDELVKTVPELARGRIHAHVAQVHARRS